MAVRAGRAFRNRQTAAGEGRSGPVPSGTNATP